MKISRFASRFDTNSGIVQLMEDLGDALSTNKNMLMMGGGNPSHIPEVQQFFHDKMQRVLDRPAEFAHMIGDYESPQGDKPFIEDFNTHKEIGLHLVVFHCFFLLVGGASDVACFSGAYLHIKGEITMKEVNFRAVCNSKPFVVLQWYYFIGTETLLKNQSLGYH